jgi:uncharacterized protein
MWRQIACLAVFVSCNAASAAELSGTWSGVWSKGGDALSVAVTFQKSGNGYSGSFDSDALQVAGIPFADVSERGNNVHFVLKGDRTTTIFDGAQTADTLTGTFSENNARGTFQLKRTEAQSVTIETREVDFRNGNVKLAGTLLLPRSTGRYSAILFLHGSGPEGRFANRWLAKEFAEAGFAALITDKRGVGQSTGDWRTAGFDELAGDAVAGVRFLEALPEVNAKKIGIYGHSQGGTIAPLVAERAGDLAFIVAAAAGGIDPATMEEYSVGNSIGIASLSPRDLADARTFVHAIVEVAYHGKPRKELDTLSAKFRDRAWYFDPPPPDNFYWSFARRIAAYDPARHWRQVKAPVLLLFGNSDQRVPPKADSEAIAAALHAGGNDDVTLKMFANADHTFSLPNPNGGWPKHVPRYAEMIVEWAKAKAR